MQRGMKKSRFSTNISLYLWNHARYSHSFWGRRIGNRTQAIEWYQLEWSWVTSNPDFKVTSLSNLNGTRYRHSLVTMNNEVLMRTYALLKNNVRMTLSELTKYSVTRIIARSLCDSWASCSVNGGYTRETDGRTERWTAVTHSLMRPPRGGPQLA